MWSNAAGEQFYVQYHFKTEQGPKNLTGDEAAALKSSDPDYATRDLFEAIERGDYPSWRLEMQIMPVAEAEAYRYDVFDITKVWPHADYPPMTIGRMVLDRNPENYFAEVEQAAFSPANFVPGIGPVQRQDAAGSALQLPRHAHPPAGPELPPAAGERAAGTRRSEATSATASCASTATAARGRTTGPTASADRRRTLAAADPGMPVSGETGRTPYPHPNDDFEQAGVLYRVVMTDEDRDHLVSNLVGHLSNAQERIRLRQCAIFYKADPEYGTRVAEGVGSRASPRSNGSRR